MNLFNRQNYLLLGIIAVFELISFGLNFFPNLQIIGGLLILSLALFLSFKKLEYGLLLLFTELIIGSKGHLFHLSFLSARMLIFIAIFVAYFFVLRRKEEQEKIKIFFNTVKSKYLLASLGSFIILGLILAIIKFQPLIDIFQDFNSWMFFLLIFPVISVYYEAKEDVYRRLANVSMVALLFLSLQTLALLYIFTHNIYFFPNVYSWLRKSGLAEVTVMQDSFARIFFQSHIYSALAVVMIPLSLNLKKKSHFIFMTLAWSSLIISMSRSLWLATALTLILVIFRGGWLKIKQKLIFVVLSFIASLIIIFSVSLFPFPTKGNFSVNSYTDRVSVSDEAAISSRWALLPELLGAIKKNVIFGQGFAYPVSYFSQDPRVLEKFPDTAYETYSFEWGYLAFWLKIGLFGLSAYLLLLAYLIIVNFKDRTFLSLSILLLALVHIFTPYLDHPLGISFLLIVLIFSESCIKTKNKVY